MKIHVKHCLVFERVIFRLERFVFKKMIYSYKLDNFKVVEMSDFDFAFYSYTYILAN